MKKNKTTKIVAIVALLAMLLGVLGTGINFILSMMQEPEAGQQIELTPEQIKQIQDSLNNQDNANEENTEAINNQSSEETNPDLEDVVNNNEEENK